MLPKSFIDIKLQYENDAFYDFLNFKFYQEKIPILWHITNKTIVSNIPSLICCQLEVKNRSEERRVGKEC